MKKSVLVFVGLCLFAIVGNTTAAGVENNNELLFKRFLYSTDYDQAYPRQSLFSIIPSYSTVGAVDNKADTVVMNSVDVVPVANSALVRSIDNLTVGVIPNHVLLAESLANISLWVNTLSMSRVASYDASGFSGAEVKNVPEPNAVLLLGLTLVVLSLTKRKKVVK